MLSYSYLIKQKSIEIPNTESRTKALVIFKEGAFDGDTHRECVFKYSNGDTDLDDCDDLVNSIWDGNFEEQNPIPCEIRVFREESIVVILDCDAIDNEYEFDELLSYCFKNKYRVFFCNGDEVIYKKIEIDKMNLF